MADPPTATEHESPRGVGARGVGVVSAESDAAERSLADALRVCFWALKAVMVLTVVGYLFTGLFNISEQEKAVRLRFGRIVGEPGQQVLGAGGPYAALPFPVEQVIRIATSAQQIELHDAFWYEITEANRGKTAAEMQGRAKSLNPERDGSLLTGDSNIVHARWSVTYTVTRAVDYTVNVGDAELAQRLVRAAAERGAVYAVAQMAADELVKSQNTAAAMRQAQAMLDGIESGISITAMSLKDAQYPLSVRASVQAVLDAENVRARLTEEAQEQWTRTLVETAGEGYRPLLGLIEAYELASAGGDAREMVRLEGQMDGVFDRLEVGDGEKVYRIGGRVAEVIHDAKTYRTEVVAQIAGEADYFASLLTQYRRNPRIVLNRLWEDTRAAVLTGDVETVYLPRGRAFLDLNRDPAIQRERERRRLSAEQAEREAGR